MHKIVFMLNDGPRPTAVRAGELAMLPRVGDTFENRPGGMGTEPEVRVRVTGPAQFIRVDRTFEIHIPAERVA